MNAINNPRRRAVDRFPLSDRLTWAVLRGVDAVRVAAPKVVGVCAVAVFWLLLGVVFAAGVAR